MKTILALALALTATTGFSATIKIFEELDNVRFSYGSFGVNEKLGRAWAVLDLEDKSPMSDSSSVSSVRVLVPGLSLVGDTVVLEVEGQQVECAKVRTVGRIFRNREVKSTGNCFFTKEKGTRTFDDGFDVDVRKTLIINLVTK